MNTTLSSLTGWFLRHRKKIAEIGFGMTLYAIFNWLFNYPLYMWAVGYFGLINGGLVMSFLSLIQCSVLLVVFDRMGIDWVGATYLEEVAKKDKKNRVEKALVWALKKESQSVTGKLTKFVGFVTLSVFVDPFVVTVHFRQKQFSGITRHDWAILTTAVFFANLYWTLRTGILVTVIKEAWQRF